MNRQERPFDPDSILQSQWISEVQDYFGHWPFVAGRVDLARGHMIDGVAGYEVRSETVERELLYQHDDGVASFGSHGKPKHLFGI